MKLLFAAGFLSIKILKFEEKHYDTNFSLFDDLLKTSDLKICKNLGSQDLDLIRGSSSE